jgi:hypothetical protein
MRIAAGCDGRIPIRADTVSLKTPDIVKGLHIGRGPVHITKLVGVIIILYIGIHIIKMQFKLIAAVQDQNRVCIDIAVFMQLDGMDVGMVDMVGNLRKTDNGQHATSNQQPTNSNGQKLFDKGFHDWYNLLKIGQKKYKSFCKLNFV